MNDFKHYRGRGRGSFQHNNFRGGSPFHNARRTNPNAFSPILPLPHFRDNKHRWQRPPHPNMWRNGPPRMSPFIRHQIPPPFIHQRPPMVEARPVSPLPGSEEARQKVIAEASARIKEQLNLNEDGCVRTEQIAAPTITSFSDDKFDEDVCIIDQTFAEVQKPPEKLKRRTKKPSFTEPNKSVEELRNKILTQFTYMSKGKIQSLVNNPGSSKYDGYLQHLVRDMRLHLSSELRNMYNNRETDATENNEMIDHFNSIVPDLGVELVSLPDTMVAELSKILQFDVNNEIISSPQLNETTDNENALVEPEDMFKQAEKLLSNTDFLNSSFENQLQESPEFLTSSFENENINQPQVNPDFLRPLFENENLNRPPNFISDTFPPDFPQNNHQFRLEQLNNDPFMHRSPLCNEPPPFIPPQNFPLQQNFSESNNFIPEQNFAPVIEPIDMEIDEGTLAADLTPQFIEQNSSSQLEEIPLPDVDVFPTQTNQLKTPSRDSSPFSKKILEANLPVNLVEPTFSDQSRVRSSSIPASNPFLKSPNYSNSPQMRSESNESRVPEKTNPKLFNFDSVWLFKPKIENVTSFLDDVVSHNLSDAPNINKNIEMQNKIDSPVFETNITQNKPNSKSDLTKNIQHNSTQHEKNILINQKSVANKNLIQNVQQTPPIVENIVNPAEILKSLNTILAQAQNLQHSSKRTIEQNLIENTSKELIKSLKSFSNMKIQNNSPQTVEKNVLLKPTANLIQNVSSPVEKKAPQNKPNETEKLVQHPQKNIQTPVINKMKLKPNAIESNVNKNNRVENDTSNESALKNRLSLDERIKMMMKMQQTTSKKDEPSTQKTDEAPEQPVLPKNKKQKMKERTKQMKQKQNIGQHEKIKVKVHVEHTPHHQNSNIQPIVSNPDVIIKQEKIDIEETSEENSQNQSENMNTFIKHVKDLNRSLSNQETTENRSIFAGKPPSIAPNDITPNISMNSENNQIQKPIIEVRKNVMPTKAALKIIPPLNLENQRILIQERKIEKEFVSEKIVSQDEENISEESDNNSSGLDIAKKIEYQNIVGIKLKRKESVTVETNENAEKLAETVDNNEEDKINENRSIHDEEIENSGKDRNEGTKDLPEQNSPVLANVNRDKEDTQIEKTTAIVPETIEEKNEKNFDINRENEEIISNKNIEDKDVQNKSEEIIETSTSKEVIHAEIEEENISIATKIIENISENSKVDDQKLNEPGSEISGNNSDNKIDDLDQTSAQNLIQEKEKIEIIKDNKVDNNIVNNFSETTKETTEEIKNNNLSSKETQDKKCSSTDKTDEIMNVIDIKNNKPEIEIQSKINEDVIIEKNRSRSKESMERATSTDRPKNIEREKSMEKAKNIERPTSKERGKSIEKTKNERNKSNERHKSKERDERKDRRKHRSHSRERSKDSKHKTSEKDEKRDKSKTKDNKNSSVKHDTKKDEHDHKTTSKSTDNKSRSKHRTDTDKKSPKTKKEIKIPENAIKTSLSSDRNENSSHSTSGGSHNGDNQSVINRLMEIDLQIQKLMQEKWDLYKQLNISVINSSAIPVKIVENQQPFKEVENQKLVNEVVEFQQPVKEIPEITSNINETLKIRPVSATPSETSTLSEYSKKHFNSRALSLPRSESSLNDLEKHETDDEITEKVIPKKKKEKFELKSQIYRLSLEKNKSKKLDDDSDVDSPIPIRKRKRGKSPIKRDLRNSKKAIKIIDSDTDSEMPVKKREKVEKKAAPKKNNKSVKKDSKEMINKNCETNEKHVEKETTKKVAEKSVENKSTKNDKKKIEFPETNIKNEPEIVQKQSEIVEKPSETVEEIESKAVPETVENQPENEKKSLKKRKKKSSFIEDEQEEPNKKFFIKIKKPEKKKTKLPETNETEKSENKETETTPEKTNKRQRRKQKDESEKNEILKEETSIETENNYPEEIEMKVEDNKEKSEENLNNNNESEKEKKLEYKIKYPENDKSIKLKIIKSEIKNKEEFEDESSVEKPSNLRRSRRTTIDENVSQSSENILIAPASIKKKRAKKTDEETNRSSRSRSTSKESDLKNLKIKKPNDSSDEEDLNQTVANQNKIKLHSESEASESSQMDETIRVDKKINAKRKRKLSKDVDIVEVNKIVPEVVKTCFVKLERIKLLDDNNVKEDQDDSIDDFDDIDKDFLKEADKEIDDIISHYDDTLEDSIPEHVFIIPSPIEKEVEEKEDKDFEEMEDFRGYDKQEIPDINLIQPLELNSEIENEDKGIFCAGHRKSILDIKIIGDEFLAASEDGTIYKYCLKTGELQDAYTGHKRAVTCMYLMSGKILDLESTIMYSGSLDCSLKCYNIDTAEILHSVVVEQAIQCMDSAWGYIFLGTYEGLLFIYDIKKKLLNDQSLTIANATVLMIKATQEGSRQVLILASRKREIMVRDAFTGLLLRTMCQDQKPTIYSLLLDRSMVYCGTSDKGILILDFHNGMQTGLYNSGKGVVCMVMYKILLFAGCYDGMIYIYNTKTQKHIITLPGPGEGMLLSLAISDGMIIAGTKKDHLLKIWKIPQEILNEID